jgi:SAM-dependent methyltransferase
MSSAPPTIFSDARRLAARRRMLRAQLGGHAVRFVLDDMVGDVVERLAFLRHTPRRVLAIGDLGAIGAALAGPDCKVSGADPAAGLNEERPYPIGGFDLVVSLGTLDTVNDLPGALIHIREALAPGGLSLASFVGAGSLPTLRAIMLAADGDRPAPRLHPMVDVRAGAGLLQRAGLADPVADGRAIAVAYRSLDRLVADIRAQGLGNVLASPGPPLGKAALARARAAFDAMRDAEGRVVECFEIVTLSGWRPSTGSG